MSIIARLAAFVSTFGFACLAQASALWFADAPGIHRIETDTNIVVSDIGQPGVLALTLDQKDGSLWALTASQLFKYDASGAPGVAIDLKTLSGNFNAARRLALDPSDDSIWVAGGNNAFHLDANGRVIASVVSNDVVQDIALTQDETLWILSRNALSRYSPQGALLATASLAGGMQQAVSLAADDANGVLWLAGNKSLFQIAIALPVQTRRSLATSEVVSGIALDAGTGSLWVAGQSSLFGFTKDGAAFASTALAQSNLGNFQALDFDAQSQSLWLGHEKGISRFTSAGLFVVTVPATVKVGAIAAAPSGIVPIVTLVAPPNGALTRNAFVPIRVHYDASCFGQPCGFPSSVFAAYTLTATLNGQSIGGSFVFDPATNDAVYTPAVRHVEGVNTFTAFVTDSSGRRSRTITSRFTVDTVAPRFVNVTPADGSTFTSPGIALQGLVDDPSAIVVLESFSGATFTGPNPQGQSFSYAINLVPGTNSFRLTATDPAGNANQLSLTYVFSTLTITIVDPANGATIDDNKVTVTGSFTGAATATITVNGIPALVSGNAFTAADVPLRFGSNTITATGTSPQGARDTKSITVNSTAPSITITSPADGSSINADHVLVTGRIQAPPGSGVSVNGVIALVDASGNYYANGVVLVPGLNVITASVSNRAGKSSSATVSVNASGASPLAISADPVSGIAPLAVKFKADNRTGNAIASIQVNPGGAGSFSAPPDPSVLAVFTYTQPGTYLASVTVTDSVGNAYSQQIAIQANDLAQMDQLFRAIWSGMNDALIAGDKATAMTFLNTSAKAKYGPVFDALMPNMPQIIASYSTLQRSSVTGAIAEYAVRRAVPGGFRVYLIYFIQDSDGVWRIDEM